MAIPSQSQSVKGMGTTHDQVAPSDDVVRLLLLAQAYCFDVDSTLVETEGIDELAEATGRLEQVMAITNRQVD
jgi:hypothetical protein